MTSEGGGAGADELDPRHELLGSAWRAGSLPGIVGAVFSCGDVVWTGAQGSGFGQYRVGSITKTFTAVGVLQLRDLGLLDLNDPVGLHVHDAPFADHAVRSLLAHNSGLTAEPAGPWWERSPGLSWRQLADANADAVDVFAPGQRYHYSNLSFAVLGELVARLRRRTWFGAVKEFVLEPLGLSSTTYDPTPHAATGTSRDPRDGRLAAEPAYDTRAMAPAGQLWSTVADLARWGDFLAVGSDSVLAQPTLVEMRTAQSADPDAQHVGAYGLGLRLRWTGDSTLVGHTGSMPGFLAAMFVDPASRLGAAVLTNATTGLDTETLVARLIESSRSLAMPPAPEAGAEAGEADRPEPARSPADELAGLWFWGNTELSLSPTATGFSLRTDRGARSFAFEATEVFRGMDGYFAGEALRVVRRADGSVSHLEVVSFVFTRVPYDPAAPIPGGVPGALG